MDLFYFYLFIAMEGSLALPVIPK